MEDDKKAQAKRPAGSEGRESLHEYVGGEISNPITRDTPDESERRGGSGTKTGGTAGAGKKTGSRTEADTR